MLGNTGAVLILYIILCSQGGLALRHSHNSKETSSSQYLSRNHTYHLETFSNDLQNLFYRNLLPDINIKLNKKEIASHRAVLAARSDVFRQMFEDKCKDYSCLCECKVTIHIDVTEPYVGELFLEYLYTGRMPASHYLNHEVCKLAEKYEVKSLVQRCRHPSVKIDIPD